MKNKLILTLCVLCVLCVEVFTQSILFNKSITVAAGDTATINLDGIYEKVVIYPRTDSLTVELNVDSTFYTARVNDIVNDTNISAATLDAGIYQLLDPVIRTMQFINPSITDIIVELKARREF